MEHETLNMQLRVLVVCSANSGKVVPYIQEQVEAIANQGALVDYFLIQRKGVVGYVRAFKKLLSKINAYKPDIIHAHYGLSGLFATMQRKVPVVTTYHGSDINNASIRFLSRIAIKLSKYNIFVSQKLAAIVLPTDTFAVVPCGVDLTLFYPQDKKEARQALGLNAEEQLVLFAGAFTNSVKNYPLAKAAVDLLPSIKLIELKGYSRQQVALLINAVDALVMCSHNEGSPQIIKEAMACNCPIVSTPVGDVPEQIKGLEGCYLSEATPESLAEAIKKALLFNKKTVARERILNTDNTIIAKQLISIYKQILNN
ncbi:MAG: glycosyltransferase [Paludibacteraceae bacterium]|nr:glycosyltransferase [Paludibacteraceae bacterium]